MGGRILIFIFLIIFPVSAVFSQNAGATNTVSETESVSECSQKRDAGAENSDSVSEPEQKQSEKPKQKRYFGSRDEIRTRIFSLDFDYLTQGLKNNGWGLGIRYEQYIWNHIAAKFCFGHSTFIIDGNWSPTVSFGIFAEYYPFQKGLDGLYVAFGSYFDFIALPESAVSEESDTKAICLSIYPLVGYKLRLFKWLSTDFYCGYKYILPGHDLPSDFQKYITNGVKLGVSLKFHFFQ